MIQAARQYVPGWGIIPDLTGPGESNLLPRKEKDPFEIFPKNKKALDNTDISVYHIDKGVVDMKTNEAVREIMNQQEVGVSALASRLGKTPRLVSDRLSQENISIEKLNEMLRVLDYKVVVVPRSRVTKKDEYEVE